MTNPSCRIPCRVRNAQGIATHLIAANTYVQAINYMLQEGYEFMPCVWFEAIGEYRELTVINLVAKGAP